MSKQIPDLDGLNIYKRLALVRDGAAVLQKSKSGYGYKYVPEDQILATVTAGMKMYHLSLIPNIIGGTTKVIPYSYTKTKALKTGGVYDEKVNEILITADMEWIWVNDDKPDERISVPWTMVAQQADAAQAFGSALTYTNRYFLLKYFNAATTENDPDKWRSTQRAAEERASREAAASIVAKIHETAMRYTESHPDDKAKVTELVKKYVRDASGKPSANYMIIQDPVVAAKLLEALESMSGNDVA